jgi:hypothetical protein
VLAISAVAFLFFLAVAIDFHSFAERVPWAGRSSDPQRQRRVVEWGRLMSGVWAVIAVIFIVDGIRLIATG